MTTIVNEPHERRVGDTVTVYSANLVAKDNSSPPADAVKVLTGLTVTFTMINAATLATKVSAAAATIVTAASGIVSYDFVSADVDTAGIYWGSFNVVESAESGTYPASPCDGIIWIHSATQTAQQAYDAAVAAL